MTPEDYAAARDEYRQDPTRKNTFEMPADAEPPV
jgi:hypothetical protein